ncbi:hypothetical protein SDC9_128152 [bioreactor metagenome]|uniref:3-(cis-5,6-dihydroxycyclohexa-1,3-dien-1-yl)propanoate dehydrogenase n=1 Tax=bioreactor metagenome TaxID=1076179 RepID=A0A645CVB2_9ZZZZ|nr:SDR family NAD(P)-dependent oxidoreductase [Lachnospiraceae bacterium]
MKTWLITGSSSGIGKGIAKAVLTNGDQAVLIARNIGKLQELVDRYPETSYAVKMDVSDSNDRKSAVAKAVQKFGSVDVLVNSAGYGYRSAVEEGEENEIRKLFDVNFFGPSELIREILPQMRERKNGIIINITSMGGIRGAVGNGWYSAAKGSLELLSDTLYKECRPLGIQVLTVEPGAFRTGFYGELRGTKNSIHDYMDTAGRMHIENMVNRYDQLGDPDKAGQIIVNLILVNGGKLPKRFALGSDAVQAIQSEYESRLSELNTWKTLSCSSDYEDGGKR